MGAEAIAGLVVVVAAFVIIEDPARALAAARLVDQVAELVGFTLPEPPNPAFIPMLLPQIDIDMAVAIERRDELIAVAWRPSRKLFRAREIEADKLECLR